MITIMLLTGLFPVETCFIVGAICDIMAAELLFQDPD